MYELPRAGSGIAAEELKSLADHIQRRADDLSKMKIKGGVK
jgi:hypothetical protein